MMDKLQFIEKIIEERSAKIIDISQKIWELAELPYEEFESYKILVDVLKDEGFAIEDGIADMPTAFTATFKSGSGKPVMGLLGEYDALYGLSQEASCTHKSPIIEGGSGHGCGHNLLGAGSVATAIALKEYLSANNLDGTVIYFGCPAEEGAGSKQFIARAGYFDNVDFVYTWHPSTFNQIGSKGNVAIMGANFTFDGVSSHAGGSPHLGRSALDSAELMNIGVNYLREHMIDSARIHYAYSDAGGTAPNVVQDHVVIKYEVRAPKVSQMQELFARVLNVAKGAALMMDTKVKCDITMAFSDYLPNKTLATVAQEAFEEVGVPNWTEENYKTASSFLRTYNKTTLISIKETLLETFEIDEVEAMLEKPLSNTILPFDPKEIGYSSGSTDVGDVGYATPTLSINAATACIGNVGHSWQNTAFSNSEIGYKGMLTAAKVMALASIKTMERPDVIEKAKKELAIKNGGKYTCPLPDSTKPPIGTY